MKIDRLNALWLKLLWPSLIVTAILAGINLIPRWQAERSNRAVSLVVEFATVRDFALSQGVSVPDALAELSEIGVKAIALNEKTAGDLISSGQVSVTPSPQTTRGLASNEFLITGRASDLEWIQSAYQARTGKKLLQSGLSGAVPRQRLLTDDPQFLRSITLGVDPAEAKLVRDAGLAIVGRIANPIGTSPRSIDWNLGELKRHGAEYYLPLGDAVLGDRELVNHTIQSLESNGLIYVAAEFGKTSGESKIVGKLQDQTVRLHAAQAAELQRMAPAAIVERYVKAARERNIRMLLVRPASASGEQPLGEFNKLLREIRQGLEHDGLTLKAARPFAMPESNSLLKLILGLATVPVMAFVASRLFSAGLVQSMTVVGAGLLGLATISTSLREYTALAASIAFPIAGYLWWLEKDRRPVWLFIAGISAFSFVGGLQVAGHLTGLKYMLHLDIFTGVKLSVFLPILIVGLILAFRLKSWKQIGETPVLWGSLVASIVGLGVLMFMNARTGNDNPAAVSGLELQFRDLLDRLLFVRPRTKEFLIGHPALVVGAWLALVAQQRSPSAPIRSESGELVSSEEESGTPTLGTGEQTLESRPLQTPFGEGGQRPGGADSSPASASHTETPIPTLKGSGHPNALKPVAYLLLAVGAIGQTSIVNTMCHLHTPIHLSVARILSGLVAGCILGVLVILVAQRVWPDLRARGSE